MNLLILTIFSAPVLLAAEILPAQEPPADTIPWPAANQLSVIARARLDSRLGDTIQLSYSVESAPSSVQSGRTFTVRAYARSWVVAAPVRWVGDSGRIQDSSAVIWSSFSVTDLLTPGTQLTGFVTAGVGATDLVGFRVRGHYDPPLYDDTTRIQYASAPSIWANAAQGSTVGIVPTPTGTPSQLLSRLSSLNTQSCDLGWVSPSSVCVTLAGRLTSASSALAGGDITTARSEMDAYISEIETRRSGDVSEDAFALLWPNAKTVRERL